MRIIIKNADFSSVSIGKVVKDLSFSFDSSNGAGPGKGHGDNATINAFFPNWNNGTPTETEYYSGSEGGTVTMAGTTANRIVSDFHEVSEGMLISLSMVAGGSSIPNIIAFAADKSTIVSSACKWGSGVHMDSSLVVPEGVKYIKFQTGATTGGMDNLANGYTTASGTMPE